MSQYSKITTTCRNEHHVLAKTRCRRASPTSAGTASASTTARGSSRAGTTALPVSTAKGQQAAASSLWGSWTGGSRGSGFLQGWQNTWLRYRMERIGKSRDDAIFCKRTPSEHANTRHPHLPATGQPWNPRPPLPEPAQWERVSSPTDVYFSALSSTAPAPMEPKTHQPHAAFSPKAVCHL